MKKSLLWICLLAATLCPAGLWAQEPYAVLEMTPMSTVLTFYYDDQMDARGGMTIYPFELEQSPLVPGEYVVNSPWFDYRNGISNVVFDASFADCTTLTSTAFWFYEFTALTTIEGLENLNTPNVEDMRYMFKGCSALESLDLGTLKTDNVKDMSSMFADCYSLLALEVTSFNTAAVVNMSNMFNNCAELTVLDVSGFTTANVTDMSGMFWGCSGLDVINVTAFNTANVTNMSNMFNACMSMPELDLSSFDTSKVTNMESMFSSCTALTTIYASNLWSTESVTNGDYMFVEAPQLVGGNGTEWDENFTDYTYAHIDKDGQPGYFTEKVPAEPEPYAVISEGTKLTFYYDTHRADYEGYDYDIGPFTTSSERGWKDYRGSITEVEFDASLANCTSITSTAWWFSECQNLTTITGIGNLKTDNTTNMEYMFRYCSGLTSLDVSGFKTDNVTDMRMMFEGCSNLTILDVSGFKTDNVTNMDAMFEDCSSLTNLDVSGFKTDKVTNMDAMFWGCSGLTSLDVSGWNTSNVTDMNGMFNGCSNLTTLDVSGFKTDNVTSMNRMFLGCSSLTSLNVSGFITDNVSSMYEMFYDCSNLTSLDLSGFKTDNVKRMESIFRGCSGLTNLDISGFKTDNVTNIHSMFYNCSSLTSIYAGVDWSTDKVEIGHAMFTGCTQLVGGKGTAYDENHVDYTYAHIDGGPSNPGYFTDKNAPAEPEPYAVLVPGTMQDMKLVFYYDTNKADFGDQAFGVGPFTYSNGTVNSGWYEFREAITEVEFDASFANCTSITSTAYWFMNCNNLTTITAIGNLKTDNVTNMYGMFSRCSALASIDLSGFKTGNVTDMTGMFNECFALTSLDLSGFQTDNVTNMSFMFNNCNNLTSLDVSSFKTDKVTNMSAMFLGCSGLTSLDVSSFKTNNVTAIDNMFYGCSGLTSLDVSGFKTDNVTKIEYMFLGCSGLTSLDLSNFNTTNVTDMRGVFRNCSSLTTIYAGDTWSTENVAEAYGGDMFTDCTQLVGGAGTAYDNNHVDYTYAHIDGGPSNPGYFTDKNAPAEQVATPTFSVSGDYDLAISTQTEGATIYYTMDGTTPTPQSTLYEGAITLEQDCTVLAIATKQGYQPSEVAEYEANWVDTKKWLTSELGICRPRLDDLRYQLEQKASPDQAPDLYELADLIDTRITTAETALAAAHTLDDVMAQEGEVNIIYEMLTDLENAINAYSPAADQVAAPSFSINGYTLTISTQTEGATIYYTMDGSTPTPQSTNYTGGITLEQDCTVLAIAVKEGYNDSEVAEYVADWVNMKKNVESDITSCLAKRADLENKLGQKATPDQAPNLYNELEYIKLMIDDVAANLSTSYTLADVETRQDEVYIIWERLAQLEAQIEAFSLEQDMTATPEMAFNYSTGTLTISCATSGNTIYYNIGTGETITYMGPLTLTDNVTVTAYATAEGYNTSETVTFKPIENGTRDGDTFRIRGEVTTDELLFLRNIMGQQVEHLDMEEAMLTSGELYPETFGGMSLLSARLPREVGYAGERLFNGCRRLAAVVWNAEAELSPMALQGIDNPNLLLYVNSDKIGSATGITNLVVNQVAKEIVLSDPADTEGTSDYNFYCPIPFTAQKISYSHTYNQQSGIDGECRGWETIALPFNVQTITHRVKGDIAPFGSPLLGGGAGGGVLPFWLCELGRTRFENATAIEANTPYIISMPQHPDYDAYYNLGGDVITFAATQALVPVTNAQTATTGQRTIYANFTTQPAADRIYTMNVGEAYDATHAEGSVFVQGQRAVRPFEAYTTSTNGARYIDLFGDEADGIVKIVNGKLKTDNYVYDLSGRRINANHRQSWPGKHLIIKNGKVSTQSY